MVTAKPLTAFSQSYSTVSQRRNYIINPYNKAPLRWKHAVTEPNSSTSCGQKEMLESARSAKAASHHNLEAATGTWSLLSVYYCGQQLPCHFSHTRKTGLTEVRCSVQHQNFSTGKRPSFENPPLTSFSPELTFYGKRNLETCRIHGSNFWGTSQWGTMASGIEQRSQFFSRRCDYLLRQYGFRSRVMEGAGRNIGSVPCSSAVSE